MNSTMLLPRGLGKSSSLVQAALDTINTYHAPLGPMENTKILGAINTVADIYTAKQDGRLRAIIDSGLRHVREAYPGTWKQQNASKTAFADINRLVWAGIERRVRRFLVSEGARP